MTSQRRAWNSTLPAASKPMKRTRMRKKAPRRLARRAEDAPYVAFVRTLPCISCDFHGVVHVAHIKTGKGQVGMGHKVPDSQVVPLCAICHMSWDEHFGFARGLSELERFAIGTRWVEATRAAWEASQ